MKRPLLLLILFLALALNATRNLAVKRAENERLGRTIHVTLNDTIFRENLSFYSGRLELKGFANYLLDYLGPEGTAASVAFDVELDRFAWLNLIFEEKGDDLRLFRVSSFHAFPTGFERFEGWDPVPEDASEKWNVERGRAARVEIRFDEGEATATVDGRAAGRAPIDGRPQSLRVAVGANWARLDNLTVEGRRADGPTFRAAEDFQLRGNWTAAPPLSYLGPFLAVVALLAGAAAALRFVCGFSAEAIKSHLLGSLGPGCLFLVPAQVPSAPFFLVSVGLLSAAAVFFYRFWKAASVSVLVLKRRSPSEILGMDASGKIEKEEEERKDSTQAGRPCYVPTASNREETLPGEMGGGGIISGKRPPRLARAPKKTAIALAAVFAGCSLAAWAIAPWAGIHPEAIGRGGAVYLEPGERTLLPGAGIRLLEKDVFYPGIAFDLFVEEGTVLDVHFKKANVEPYNDPYYHSLFVDPKNDPPLTLSRTHVHEVELSPLNGSRGALKRGEWNAVALTARGPCIDVWVNGRRVGTERRFRAFQPGGKIALFAEQKPVRLRNLKIADLRPVARRGVAPAAVHFVFWLAARLAAAGLLTLAFAAFVRAMHFPGDPIEWRWGLLLAGPLVAVGLALDALSPYASTFMPDFLSIFAMTAAIALGFFLFALAKRTNGWRGGRLRGAPRAALLLAVAVEGAAWVCPPVANLIRDNWKEGLTNPGTVWRFDPDVRYQNLYFNLQQLHGRDAAPREGVRRVLLLGGSQTWGEGFPHDSREDVASRLEATICRGREARCGWEVVNAAVSGAESRVEFRFAEALSRQKAPEIVVANFGVNESKFDRGRVSDYDRLVARRDRRLETLTDEVFLWRFLKALWLNGGGKTLFARIGRDDLERFQENLAALRDLCEQNGTKLALLDEHASPNLQFLIEARDDGRTIRGGMTPLHRAMADLAEGDPDVRHLKTEEFMMERLGSALYFDTAHFTARGNGFTAAKIYELIYDWL